MKYEVGDIVRQFTDDRKVSWRGTVRFVGPTLRTGRPFGKDNPALATDDDYWIEWDNGSSNRVDSARIEFDKEYIRNKKINNILE